MFIVKARQDKRHQGLQDICSLKNVKHIKILGIKFGYMQKKPYLCSVIIKDNV